MAGHQVLQRLVGWWRVGEVTLIFCLISFIKKTVEIADSRGARGHSLAQSVGLQVTAGAGELAGSLVGSWDLHWGEVDCLG